MFGLAAGFYGGRVNMIIMRVMDVFYAFPSVLLAIANSGAIGAGVTNPIVSLTIVFHPPIPRNPERVPKRSRRIDFVEAALANEGGGFRLAPVAVMRHDLAPVL